MYARQQFSSGRVLPVLQGLDVLKHGFSLPPILIQIRGPTHRNVVTSGFAIEFACTRAVHNLGDGWDAAALVALPNGTEPQTMTKLPFSFQSLYTSMWCAQRRKFADDDRLGP